MANITSYPKTTSLSPEDLFIISDTSQDNATKSVELTTLSAYIGSSGETGTVTSVTGAGNVSGITLSGNITESGSLTLGGSLSLTSQEVINFLGYTPSSFDGNYDNLTNKPALFDGAYNSLTGKPVLFDGDYNSLTNTPTIPAEPAILSNLGSPTLATGVTAEEVRTLIGVDGSGNIVTNLSYIPSETNGIVTSSDGTDATLPLVVAGGNAGLMSGSDKNKLNGIDGTSSNFVKNNSDTFTASDKVTQIVTLSQTEYDGLVSAVTIDANTLYIIV